MHLFLFNNYSLSYFLLFLKCMHIIYFLTQIFIYFIPDVPYVFKIQTFIFLEFLNLCKTVLLLICVHIS